MVNRAIGSSYCINDVIKSNTGYNNKLRRDISENIKTHYKELMFGYNKYFVKINI